MRRSHSERRAHAVLWRGLLGLGLFTAGIAAPLSAQATRECTVRRVVDGDTFVCRDGERVRLLLVNTPEMADAPLGRLAREAALELIPPGTRVRLELGVQVRDPYGRLLAHVRLPDGRTLNRVLARRGYAQVMVVPPNVDGVARIRAAADSARNEGAGLWSREGFAGPPGSRRRREQNRPGAEGRDDRPGAPAGRRCHPSYPDVCIPPPPPDLDCADVQARRFRVVGTDPHRFDGDGDGVGCEG